MEREPSEATLIDTHAGRVPEEEGWFVVNVGEAAGFRTERFGAGVRFEGEDRFEGFGINVRVLAPGEPASLYHRESAQEAFLVIEGEALLIVGDEERRLGRGDFAHLPAGTPHVLVGAGDGRCAVLMVGERADEFEISFEPNRRAARHGASVERPTSSPREAYGDARGEIEPGSIDLPW